VIHHSDQGTQYTSIKFGHRCRNAESRLSMGPVSDCYDNSMAESFFATLECELLDRHQFRKHTDTRYKILCFIDWHDHRRPHTSLDNIPDV
jgi:putative transposase